jgi:tetratricopeptide (TPR) repeat protein
MANSLARVERFDEAIEFWERVEEADRYGTEAPRMITILTLEKTRQQAGPSVDREAGEGESAPHKVAGTKAGKREKRKKEPRELVFTRRQQLEQAVVNHPVDEDNYLQLAEFLLAEGQTFDAQQTLKKGLEFVSDPRIVERLEDVNMLRARERVESARQEAAKKATPKAYELVEKLRDESHRLELEIYRSRLERNPDDDEINFQLGVRLKQVGSLRESLDLLKVGLRVPECRAAASLEIGEVLQRYHQFPKALQFYRQATQLAASDPNQVECRKRALYRAAALATTMKVSDSARQYLSELVKMDPNYRDAKTRLDRLQKIGHH